MNTVRVWDLPTRIFHWLLVLCVVGLVITGNVGGDAMRWHFRLGYTVIALLLFRVAWGCVGGHWSRFASFVVAPWTAIAYARGRHAAAPAVGHNPMGAYSVLALLCMLAVQASAGLMADDEIMWSGPLAAKVSSEWVRVATSLHTSVSKGVLIALIVLHIAAIVWYRVRKKENLVRPMLTGDKELAQEVPASRDDLAHRLLALGLLACCGAAVYALVAWAQP